MGFDQHPFSTLHTTTAAMSGKEAFACASCAGSLTGSVSLCGRPRRSSSALLGGSAFSLRHKLADERL